MSTTSGRPPGFGREQVDEDPRRVTRLLLAGAQQADKHLLGVSAGAGAIAAPHFAIDDGWPDGLFGAPVAGLHARAFEVGE